ncbi:MAG TPA: 50S ribosomal protein L11 methyltransferase [Syntrophorhabdales bacterium]|nr:50S ribosomal protein L11 methyltransferase [Syntrophorhabdales bacterium]
MYDLIYIYEFKGDLSREIAGIKDADYVGFWKESGYSFLFFKQPKRQYLEKLSIPIRSELTIRHEDWESGAPLRMIKVGNITLHPPWETPSKSEGLHICIDPGMAFGSGYHPSTKGCLLLLQNLFSHSAPETVLDLGTGTGLLSIVCLKLGSMRACAVDNNNLSIEMARLNRRLNSVTEQMHIVMADALDLVCLPAELLVANMHYAVIDEITRLEAFYTKRYYLLSGLLASESYKISERLRERLTLVDTWADNFWFSHLFKSKL